MSGDVVKYHNDLNTVVMRKWTTEEMNFFFAIIAKMKNKGTDELTFDTDELKELVKFDPKKYDRWAKTMENVADKITDLKYRERTNSSYVVMPLFQFFKVDLNERTVTVQVTSRFEYILNQLQWQFTYYKLEEFIEIRSTYAKTMFRLIKAWKKKGKLELSVEELRDSLDIPKSYNISSINRAVINPIEQELPSFFSGFKVKKIKSNKKGNPVIGYEFTWKGEMTGKFEDFSQKKQFKSSKSLTPDWLGEESNNEELTDEDRERKAVLEKELQKFWKDDTESKNQTTLDDYGV